MTFDFNTGTTSSIAGTQPNPERVMQYEANRKRIGTAYLAWFFLGGIGGHRFYLGDNKGGLAMFMITAFSFVLMLLLIGFFTIWITAVWALIDAFLIPGMVAKYHRALAESLNLDPVMMQQSVA